ncbi:hypothetical protein B0I08_101232 [Glaciihabitans tibetensis]|uniref:CopC domain-containing protein n=1 Tax=Glaciihabitans tibetensis TaxID=1266600 RepID=A0A2T0VJ34_9MICO|nr:copper resistance CopC family protein [Glaciihabitans tibetensis]PRY70105.1 hypothetical protein B0I08_101232 [Glaciihabitans tibetensis]
MRPVKAVTLTAVGTLVLGGTLFGFASAAQAHNYLVSSTPAAGEELTALPSNFEITTNEALLESVGEGGFALEVIDEAGLYYGDGCVTIAGPTMSTAAALGEPGDYTVVWQVVSADGHTVSAEYPFTWAPADASASVVSEGSAAAPQCGDTADPEPDTAPDTEPGTGSEDTEGQATDSAQLANLSDVLWIGGAVVLLGATVAVTLVLSGRKKKN